MGTSFTREQLEAKTAVELKRMCVDELAIPGMTKKPKNVEQLAKLGEEILEALSAIGIYPEKLTSPVAIYEDKMRSANLPTLWSNEDDMLLEASNYCVDIMRNEWKETFPIE